MNAVRVAQPCEGDADSRYFPFEIFRSLPANLSDESRGLGQLLHAMREPSLSCGDEPDSYRILWRHSFTSWGAAMVRMSRPQDSWVMTAVQFGDSMKRNEVLRRERTLSDQEARDMLAAVSGFELWTRRDFSWNPNADDGAAWMVEGRRGTAYHPVLLINADELQVRNLAFAFWKSAGIKTKLTDQ